MGIFDWFVKREPSNVEVASDCIWLTTTAKFKAIAKQVRDSLAGPAAPDTIFLVAQFRDCLHELRSLAEGAAFDSSRVVLTTKGALVFDRDEIDAALNESQTIRIVVAERHPLRSEDDAIVDVARTLPCRCRIDYHVSLDDRLMRIFAGESLQNILKRLNMSEEECIASRLVSRRLPYAQEKIAECATGNGPADSAEEWFERYCPH